MNAAAGARQAFPWREAMCSAFGLLRLSPDVFWSMTLRELECAFGAFAIGSGHAPNKAEFSKLMTLFPDHGTD